jgi:hypothetical protein
LEEFSYLKGHPTLLPIHNGQSPVEAQQNLSLALRDELKTGIKYHIMLTLTEKTAGVVLVHFHIGLRNSEPKPLSSAHRLPLRRARIQVTEALCIGGISAMQPTLGLRGESI